MHMRRALQLAARGLGRTSPNPAVGAVVVKDGVIVGEGYHSRAGAPHAEVEALNQAGDKARGATLFCTLEPCCHHGRTPPCTERIAAAGICEVFYACDDPDLRCAGQGAQRLQEAGITVHRGPLNDQALRLNEAYIMHKRTGRPFLTLKLATTLDGKIATSAGHSQWITGPAARRRVHEMRDRSDAVMVGCGTVGADDPLLTTRLEDEGSRDAVRVVIDTHARISPTAGVIHASSSAPCVIFSTPLAADERVGALREAGADVVIVPEHEGKTDLHAVMETLGQRNIMSVLAEGGAGLSAGLLREKLVDKLVFFIAPRILGGDGLSAVGPLGVTDMNEAAKWTFTAFQRFENDLMVTAYPCSPD